MSPYTEGERRTVVGVLATTIMTSAGAAALTGATGVLVASVLLTFTVIVVAGGLAYAHDRRLGMGVWLLIAATLPIFGLLYAIGVWILKYLGSGVAGGLLLGLAGALGIATAYDGLRAKRPARPV
jgi:hypothetical protein